MGEKQKTLVKLFGCFMDKHLEVKDWLDEQEFYEYCQNYRHSTDRPFMPGMQNTVEAFEALKKYIRDQIEVQCSLPK